MKRMNSQSNRPWYQFSLRTMFVVLTVACVGTWLAAWMFRQGLNPMEIVIALCCGGAAIFRGLTTPIDRRIRWFD
jgi:cytosine/uracil/thiamine/allantoin permease